MARTAKQDTVRELQRTLYRAAKADPGRRFHALHDKVYRSYGNSAQSFDKITLHAVNRLSISSPTGISVTDGSGGASLPADPRTISG